MIVLLGLLASMVAQDTTGLPAKAREMVSRIPAPTNGEVSIGIRFSDDTVWLGEQVELVTAAWFPRDLRERLRRQPTLRTPAVAGLWNAPAQTSPLLAETRRVGGQVYDLYVSHQTLFPLSSGEVLAPPAVLTYSVPASSSFFAPENRHVLESRSATLHVRPIPASLAARLGAGPTARELRLQWQLPNRTIAAGSPVTVELVVSGQGNVTLWPAPEVAWSPQVRVYPEPTEERLRRPSGMIVGEKRFRFTLVVDSAGVLTLPTVRYPYFDPQLIRVRVAMAQAMGVAVLPPSQAHGRAVIPARRSLDLPLASLLVRDLWPLLLLLFAAPALRFVRLRRRSAPLPPRTMPAEDQLRWLATSSGLTGTGVVSLALRRRGISRDDAEAAEAWLAAMDRHRWGPGAAAPGDSEVVQRVIRKLHQGRWPGWLPLVALMMISCTPAKPAGWDEALARFADGDALGSTRLFESIVASEPASANAWFNLGAARWLAGDDVGSAAAWLRTTRLAPRHTAARDALTTINTMPHDLNLHAPTLPLSRDELVLLALLTWWIAALCWQRHRRTAIASSVIFALSLGTSILRTVEDSRPRGLLRAGAALKVSPISSAQVLADAPAWSVATVELERSGWYRVQLENGRRGWLPATTLAPLAPLD